MLDPISHEMGGKRKRRKRRPAPSIANNEFKIMDLDTLYDRPDIPATEPLPSFEQELNYVFRAECTDPPQVSVTPIPAKEGCQEWRVAVRSKGPIVPMHPTVSLGEILPVADLRAMANRGVPEAHRPNWLSVSYAPRIRPHVLDHLEFVRPPVHLMIRESLSFSYPWCTIGKIFVSRPGQRTKGGSGVLVGPNLLLTASHAMPWGNPNASVQFIPAYRNGQIDERFGDAWVEQYRGVRRDEGEADEHDFVICKLNRRIGDRTGWMGSWAWSSEAPYYAGNWISVGFPVSFMEGKIPAVEAPVSVEDMDGGGDFFEIETDDFTSGGWSGGPLWGWINEQPRVVGIASGIEKDFLDPTRSVFAGGMHLVDLVKYGWANWQT